MGGRLLSSCLKVSSAQRRDMTHLISRPLQRKAPSLIANGKEQKVEVLDVGLRESG